MGVEGNYQEWNDILIKAIDKSHNLNDFIEFCKEMTNYQIKKKEDFFEFFHEYEQEFIKNLRDSNFVLDQDNAHCLLFVPNLYLISLKNDYDKTIRIPYKALVEINNYISNDQLFKNPNLLQAYVNVFKDNDYDFDNTKVFFPDFIACSRYIAGFLVDKDKASAKGANTYEDLSFKEQNLIYLRYYKGKPFYDYPQHIIENLPFLLDFYKGDRKTAELVKKILKSETYSLDDENELLSMLRINKPLKEYFSSFCIDNKDRLITTLSFEERVLFTMYIKRLAHDFGIVNCKVSMFAREEKGEKQRLGAMTSDTMDIFCDKKYNTIKQVLTTACHEITHFKQFENMKFLKFDEDVDIDVYTKDSFLTITLGKEYYTKNYRSLNLEINAMIMGRIMAKEILKEDDKDLQDYKKLMPRKNKYSLESIFGSDFRSLMEMARISNDNKRYNLNTLFLEELQTAKDEDYSIGINSNFEIALKRYPLIEYEYDVERCDIQRRSITQLVRLLDESISEKDKGVYKYLIHQRFNPKKNSKTEIRQNISELKKISKVLGNTSLKEFIESILNEVNEKKETKRKIVIN